MGDAYCEGREVDCLRCSMFMAKFFRVAIMWCVNYREGLKGFVEQSEE